jgi:tetratricopeptide (TPR) repeat protein
MKRAITLLLLAFAFALPQAASAQAYKEAFNAARQAAQAKDYTTAYEQFEAALTGAIEAEDAEVETLSRRILAQLDYNFGVRDASNDKHEEALAKFNAGIEHNPEFAMNYVGKAEALKNLDRTDDAIEAYAAAIEAAASDADARGTATTNLLALIASTGDLLGGDNPSRSNAATALEQLQALGGVLANVPSYHLYIARAHNVLGNYGDARTAADAGLALDPNDRNDAAALNFVKGDSFRLEGNYDAARPAYQAAAYGDYRDQANYYIETMGQEG